MTMRVSKVHVAEKRHPTFASGRDDLVLAERKCAGVSERADESTVDARPVRLSAVFDDEDAMAMGKLHETRHVGGATIEMNDEDGLRARSDQRTHRGRSDHFCININIREDRLCADEIYAGSRCDEASWGDDDFISSPDAMCPQYGLERQ